MGAETLILSGFQLLGGLFGSGQVYGADFEQRKQKIQGWLYTYNLAGARGKYISQNILQSFTTEDPGNPSPYTQNGGIWQNDIQQYFAEVDNVLLARTGNYNEARFYNIVVSHINDVNSGTNSNTSTGSGGGSGLTNPSGNGSYTEGGQKMNLSSMSTTTMIFIFVGVIITFLFATGKIKI